MSGLPQSQRSALGVFNRSPLGVRLASEDDPIPPEVVYFYAVRISSTVVNVYDDQVLSVSGAPDFTLPISGNWQFDEGVLMAVQQTTDPETEVVTHVFQHLIDTPLFLTMDSSLVGVRLGSKIPFYDLDELATLAGFSRGDDETDIANAIQTALAPYHWCNITGAVARAQKSLSMHFYRLSGGDFDYKTSTSSLRATLPFPTLLTESVTDGRAINIDTGATTNVYVLDPHSGQDTMVPAYDSLGLGSVDGTIGYTDITALHRRGHWPPFGAPFVWDTSPAADVFSYTSFNWEGTQQEEQDSAVVSTPVPATMFYDRTYMQTSWGRYDWQDVDYIIPFGTIVNENLQNGYQGWYPNGVDYNVILTRTVS